MKKFKLIGLFCVAFLLGYGFSRVINPANSGPRMTGIGGIFSRPKMNIPESLTTSFRKLQTGISSTL